MKWYDPLTVWDLIVPAVLGFALGVIFIFSAGCSQDSSDAWKPFCRHDAVYAALTVGEEYPTRIVVGVTTKKGIRHAQAQAFIRDQWRWLAVSNGYIVIEESMRRDFVPDGYKNPVEYASRIPMATKG